MTDIDHVLSTRAETFLDVEEFLVKCLTICSNAPYKPFSNRDGYVNLGTAVNSLCEDVIMTKLSDCNYFEHEAHWQHYYGLNGTPDMLEEVSHFLEKKLAKGTPISPSNIRLVNGVSSGLEAISWILADPGDVVLVPIPTYARFFSDMNERMKTKVVGMHLEMGTESKFNLTPQLLEKEILRQKGNGEKVKGFLYCNPNNPLGVVYPLEITLALMEVCKRHKVHFISDEIYALSVFDRTVKFDSVLSIPKNQLPDPERTHVLWGLSKDFGLAGFRMGFIHSLNNDVVRCLDGCAFYTSVAVHMQQLVVNMIKDTAWLDTIYFPVNLSRLKKAFEFVSTRLSSLSVPVMKAEAGLFCWADFRGYIETPDVEGEIGLFNKFFYEAKVYLVPGSQFYCQEPGWFRIVFAVTHDELEKGLDRMEQILNSLDNKPIN